MNLSIDLNGNSKFAAIEVDEVTADLKLPIESVPEALPLQEGPKQHLRFGHIASQIATKVLATFRHINPRVRYPGITYPILEMPTT